MLDLLTLDEVQQLLRFSKTKLYQECRTGKLRILRFGRLVRVNRSDLEQYIENASDQRASGHPEVR
jgi:excisionase family DNA binding protein